MLIVEDCIISENIVEKKFCCDLLQCKGCCCIEGDAGAPLEEEEVFLLEKKYPFIKSYMVDEGIAEVELHGVSTLDTSQEPCTPLVNNRECAYVYWDKSVAKCAIEKAYLEGKISFRKPISCHLYPIRIDDYGEFKAINYHEWEICDCAVTLGNQIGVPLFQYLKEPLIRKFGEIWYKSLQSSCEQYLSSRK